MAAQTAQEDTGDDTDPAVGPAAEPPVQTVLWLPDAEVLAIMKVHLTQCREQKHILIYPGIEVTLA